MRRRSGIAAAALLVAAALGACTTTSGPEPATTSSTSSAGPALRWQRVDLPPGVEPRTLTTMGDRLLVGGLLGGDNPSPTMLLVANDGTPTPVPLTPQSPYAFLARWYSVVTDGTRIVAIGGANGGAHANVRWTTWSGTSAGVTELPQSFYAFGGWGAGELVDAVITPGGDALVGSWGGAEAGLDGAVWTFADNVWTRQDPAGTALQSTSELLVGPRGATRDKDGLLVAGSALHLTPGALSQTAALWRSTGVNTGWHRIDLPDAGAHSESVSARCPADPAEAVCVVAGQVDGALAVWTLDGDRAARVGGVPAVAVGEKDVVPAPLLRGGGGATATGDAAGTLVVSPSGGHTVVLSRTGAGWLTAAGPPGIPAAAALVGQRLYVATRPAAGEAATLYASPWPG